MSEAANDPQNEETELGFSTRTDVGGNAGTQGDATETGAPALPPTHETPQTRTTETSSDDAETTTSNEPGKPLGDNAPKLESLQHQHCPNCTTGVLYVTRYDPNALHEAGQGAALAAGHESGGAYDVECRNCGFTDSRALNPGKLWGR